MTLAQRLLLATLFVTLVTTLVLGLTIREAWRRAEEQSFHAQFETALGRLDSILGSEIATMPALVAPLCAHDPVLDAALVDLRSGELDSGRRLALSLRVRELGKAMSMDELVLVTNQGEVLGSSREPGRVGERDPKLAARLEHEKGDTRVRTSPEPRAIETHCRTASGNVTLWLYAARHLGPWIERIGDGQGLLLSLGPPKDTSGLLVESMRPSALPDVEIFATRSPRPLKEALGKLDSTFFLVGIGTVTLAVVLAGLLARGLSRPIAALAEQARSVVTGEPLPVVGRGGRELEELASAFNRAISDLAGLRKRLAATERIAARREIARAVAHEIKNPLAPIRAAVETLRRLRARNDPAFDEYFDEATRTVLDEVGRITSIVREFTEFARLPAPSPAEMDLSRTVRDVANLHAAGGVPIDVSTLDAERVIADRDQIVQVVTNLLTNAVDAARGRPEPRVTVEVKPDGPDSVQIIVRDNGAGVPKEIRERLYEPYATTKPHGTGLGLAITRRILIEHGGDIRHADLPGGGTEFTVLLPRQGPPLLTEPPPESGTKPAEV